MREVVDKRKTSYMNKNIYRYEPIANKGQSSVKHLQKGVLKRKEKEGYTSSNIENELFLSSQHVYVHAWSTF